MNEKDLKIKKYFDLYEKHSGANSYDLYFIFKGNLYRAMIKTLNIDWVRLARESSSKGGYEKLRLQISAMQKYDLIANGNAKKLISEETFLKKCKADNLNKGQECEKISCEFRGIEYKKDNVRFDKAGDVNLKRKQIQVKFENASLTQLRVIEKAVANA